MSMTRPDSASVPPIVDTSWLRDRIAADPTIAVCHVGSTIAGPASLHDFMHRHLPGARFVSLDEVLAAPASGTAGRHPLPTPTEFAEALGALGVADDATVVAYDDRGGAIAGRLVWMLRILGQRAALLDGGIDAWTTDSGGDLEHDAVETTSVERAVHDWPLDALADADDVTRHINNGGVVIDSRDAARYAGEVEPIDSVAGHVPGACNLSFADNLGVDGRFRPTDELRARFDPFTDHEDRPIVYCGSGVTACHNALAMEYAGSGLPRVYVGSWSGWTADSHRRVAIGDQP